VIIYKITHKLSGKVYIGQTTQTPRARWLQHLRKKANRPLCNAIRNWGAEAFSFEVIDSAADLSDLNDKEEYYISYHNSISPDGYNLHVGGGSCRQHPDSIEKLSAARKGPINPNYGKKASAETRLKMSLVRKGRKHTPEWRAKIAASHNPKSDLNLNFRRKRVPQAA
jgi:group I intron endonuclease